MRGVCIKPGSSDTDISRDGVAQGHRRTGTEPFSTNLLFHRKQTMIQDQQSELSAAQAVTATAISTNVIDLFAALGGGTNLNSNARIDVGHEAPYLVVTTRAAATDTGSDATLTVTIESADDAGLTTNAIVHFSTGALAFATFSPAGTRLVAIRLPTAQYRRYLGVRYTVASGPLTAGTFDAALVNDLSSSQSYKSVYRVQ
jgi:hypothetical protein